MLLFNSCSRPRETDTILNYWTIEYVHVFTFTSRLCPTPNTSSHFQNVS